MKNIFKLLFAKCLLLLLFSCNIFTDNDDESDPLNTNETKIIKNIEVNLDGALALLTKKSTTAQMSRSSTDLNSPIIKMLNDGTLAEVLKFPEGIYVPEISFIAIGPTKDVYAYFSSPITYYTDTNEYIEMQFIKLNPDNSIEIIEKNGMIQEYNWSWGISEKQKPVIFSSNGDIFYTIWIENNFYLKKYSNGISTELTTGNGITIESFFTDGTDIFYLGRNSTQDNNAYFLRHVAANDGKVTNIFYSDSGSLWIRDARKTDLGLLIHGDGIPNSDDPSQPYSGLLRLKKINDQWKFEKIVTSSQAGYNKNIKKSIFTDNNGNINNELVNMFFKRFFTDGKVPEGFDPFISCTIPYDANLNKFIDIEKELLYRLLSENETFDITSIETLGSSHDSLGTPTNDLINALYSKSNDFYYWQIKNEFLASDGVTVRTDIDIISEVVNTDYLSSVSMKAGEIFPKYFTSDSYDALNDKILSLLNYEIKTYIPGLSASGVFTYSYDNNSYTLNQAFDTPERIINKLKELNTEEVITWRKDGNNNDLILDKNSVIPYELYNYEIEWEWEGNGSEVYDKTSSWGKYRILNSSYNSLILSSFFNVAPRKYTKDEVIKYNNPYGYSKSGREYTLKEQFIVNNNLDLTAIDKLISKYPFTTHTTNDNNIGKIKNIIGDYQEVSSVLTTKFNLVEYALPTIFNSSTLYSIVEDSDSYTDNSIDYYNLQNFIYTEGSKEIYGIFSDSTLNNTSYSLVKLYNSEKQTVKEIINSDIKTTNIKVASDYIYYSNHNSNGRYSISKLKLTSGSQPETLLDYSANLELYKYDISPVDNKIYFTAQNYETVKEVLGSIDIGTKQILYNEKNIADVKSITIYE